MRAPLQEVLDRLLRAHPAGAAIPIDALGDALGAMAVSADEIDALIEALEARARRVAAPEGGGGESRLSSVLQAARTLSRELGRTPSVREIAERTSLAEESVRHALALARVIARG